MFCFGFSPQLKPFASPEQPEGTGSLMPGVKVGWEGALGRDFSFCVCFAPKEMSFLRTQGTKASEEEYSAETLDRNGNETKRLKTSCKRFSLREAVLVGGAGGPLRLPVGPPPRQGGGQMSLWFGICFSDIKNPIVVKCQVQQ